MTQINIERFTISLDSFRYNPKELVVGDHTLASALVSFYYGLNCLGTLADQSAAMQAWARSRWA